MFPSAPRSSQPRRRSDADAVLASLRDFCGALQPGDTVPTHTELMRRLDASERAVRWALDELRREGLLVRRNGAGTFIAPVGGGLDHARPGSPVAPGGTRLIDHKTIVVMAKPDHAFFDRALGLLYRHAEAHDLSLVCRLVDPETGTLAGGGLIEDEPHGFIIFRRDLAPVARTLHAAGHRVVLVGGALVGENLGVPNVFGDHEHGGYLAAKHLLDLGHDRLAFCGDEMSVHSPRLQGHERAVRQAQRRGRPAESTYLPLAELDVWKQREASGREYFARPDSPTGIAVWNDHEAVMFQSVLSHLGIRVPRDVSVVGYDDLPEGRRFHPLLTTIDSGIDAQLQAAVKLLTRADRPGPDHSVTVVPHLIRRESSAPIALETEVPPP